MEKKCQACGLVLDYEEFSKNSSRADGLQGACKACARSAYLKKSEETPIKYIRKTGFKGKYTDDEKKEVGKQIDIFKKKYDGITYEDVGKMLGVSDVTASKFYNGYLTGEYDKEKDRSTTVFEQTPDIVMLAKKVDYLIQLVKPIYDGLCK